MISEKELKQICDKYEIDAETLIRNNPNVLVYGEADDIYTTLEFLKQILDIDG